MPFTQIVAGQSLTAAALDAAYGYIPVTSVVTGGAQSIGTTATAITGMSQPVTSGVLYRVRGKLLAVLSASPVSLTLGFTGPTMSLFWMDGWSGQVNTTVQAASGPRVGALATLGSFGSSTPNTSAGTLAFWFDGTIQPSASGTLQVTALVPSGTNTVAAGSYLEYWPA